MKKSFLLLLLTILLFPGHLHAEEQCSTDAKHTWLMENDPAYRETFLANQEKIKQYMQIRRPYEVESVLKIPVVVHVIHEGEPVGTGTNISDAQIRSAIAALNEDYRKIAGTNGDGDGEDTNIEFCLAVRNPDNRESTGINRVDGTLSITDYITDGITGIENGGNEEDVKALSKWPNTDYYNIWIVNKIEGNDQEGTQGYAYFPGAGPNLDGAVILHNAFGTTGNLKSFTNLNRTITHELGHAFNLLHTFDESKTECYTESDCSSEGDSCCDTPPTIKPPTPSCSPVCINSQVENYMDYTPQECKNMFTSCQKTRMRAAIENSRSSLLTSNGCEPVTPPVSDFTAPSPTCSGYIQFTDTSTNGPDTWAWSFPGGTPSTSTDKNPLINYPAGTYDVTLTAGNTINGIPTQGTTETKTDYLKVFDAPPATCTVTTTDTSNDLAMGIYNVSLNTIDHSSEGAVADNGYLDLTCTETTTLEPGRDYPISVTTGPVDVNNEDVRVYIDYDNNGIFRLQEELAFSSDDTGPTHTGTVSIPGGVITNSLVRMRVISDWYPNTLSACSDSQYGQAEDYGVIFQATNTPVSDFSTEANPACTGQVQFYNQSANGSSSWEWSFPGGTPSTSTEVNPSITYNNAGRFDVSLTATNEIGSGTTETKTGYIGIYSLQNAQCAPTTANLLHPDHPNTVYGSGILNFNFNTINNSSGTALEDDQTFGGQGYVDFSCSQTTVLSPGTNYPVSITGGNENDRRAYIYIDYNNDGDFEDQGELVFDSTNSTGEHTGSFTTASNPTQNAMLRMRVITSLNDLSDSCNQANQSYPGQTDYGQAEDYGVVFPGNFATFSVSQPSAAIAGPDSVAYTVTYSDADTITLSASDISLQTTGDANGTVSVSGSGDTWTVTVSSLTGNGTLAIDIATGTATDAAGNPAPGKTSSSFTVDTTLPVVSISSPADGLKTSNLTPVLDYTVTEANPGTTTVTVNSTPITHTPGAALSLEDGTSVIVVTHTDAAGNIGSAVITIDANQGDINHDGAVNLTDVILAMKLLATSLDVDKDGTVYAEADLDGDQKIGLHEIVFILRKLTGIP
jgi:PKD repeat protein